MLAACTDFKERQNIRGALRELKGLKLDGDTVITYSFGPKSIKTTTSFTSPKSENGKIFPKQTNYKSVDENSFLEKKYNKTPDRTCFTKTKGRRQGKETVGKDENENHLGKGDHRPVNISSLHQNVTGNNVQDRNVNQNVISRSSVNFEEIKSSFENKSSVQERNVKKVSPSKSEELHSEFEYKSSETSKNRSNVKEILSESFMNRVNEIKSTFEKHKEERPKFKSYFYAGTLSTPTRDLEDDSPRPVQRCVSVSTVSKEITNENSDTKESVIKQPVSLPLKEGSDKASTPVSPKKEGTQSPRKPRKISYRTSPFLPSSQLDQISSSVSRGRLKKDLNVVDSTSKTVGPVPATAEKSANPPVTNQASKQYDTNLIGRHSVPTVSSRRPVSKYTNKILVTNQSGRHSVFEQSGIAADHTDGHLPSKHTDRHSNKVRQSMKNQTRSQPFPEKGVTRVSFRSEKSDTNMKADTGKRLASDSSVPSQKSRNDVNSEVYRDELERVRSKSQGCNTDVIMGENIMDLSVQKKKVGLSRRNRVDSSDSAKSVKKFRRKGKTDDEPLTSLNTPQPHPEIVISPVNGEYHIKSVQKSSHVRRKLPEIPVSKEEREVENDETVHERTIRLLQERRKERLDKIIKEKEVEPKSGKVKTTPEKIKNLQEKLERSDSKRKACRVRRELQLLNRETKLKSPVAVSLEAEFSAILKASEAVTDKENIQTLVKRSHSDVVRKPPRAEIEVSCREKTNDIEKGVCSVAKEVEDLLLQPLTPDKKIDLIGSLMQEEAKIQEMLRRSTSFTDKRKMRAEVRQLREKRNALEGASVPTHTLQRCASVSAGVITQASTPDGNRITELDFVATQPTIEDLRKQLSETTDYDEKKKIRLALRQLRQQSRDGAPTPSGLQRSQSFVHKKPSETEVKSERQSESVSLFRSQSDSESKVNKDQTKKPTASNEIANLETVSKSTCNNLEQERELNDFRQPESVIKLNSNNLKNAKFSHKPPLPISKKQSDVGNGDTRVTQVEAGSLPPHAPKRHSFALGTESKLRTQSGSSLNGSQADAVNSDSEKTIVSSEAHSDSNEPQQDDPSKDVKFKSKFASILISRANIDRRRSTSDLLSETKTISSFSSQDSEKPIRSETTSFRVTDIEDRAHKSPEKPSVKNNTDTDSRLTPNIEWLEDKKRTIPTPNELDKLMSSMDIEAAFSQILDAVETTPANGDIEETVVPESPIMEEESESSTSSIIELKNIADSKPKMDEQFEENINKKDSYKEITSDVGNERVQMQPAEIKEKSLEMQNGDVSDVHNLSGVNGDDSNGAIHEDNSHGKSDKTVQLRSDLSLDVTKHPDKSSAISVIHGDDGTVTVQEVNRMEKGDTVITEWKKLRRTNSKTETRETDTVVEKRITSPGGSSHVYEKDVSKTKRKITSRGSEYFSRNHYNIRKRKDLEGMEISEHELDSESANMSISKNESWGERSEAKAILNRDANNEIIPKRLSITRNEADSKSESDVKNDMRTGVKVTNRLSAGTKTSSGYGSVSPSDDDLGAVVEAHLGRPSGCPEVTSALQTVTVEDGCAAVLEFKCRGYPIPSLAWYKGDNPLEESNRVKFRFDDVSGKAYLEIDPVSQDDLGDYKCVVKNALGSASTCGRLNVKTKSTTLPWFLTKLSDITVTEGQSIVLECEVSEVDTVMWFKDGIIQRNSPDLRQTFDGKIAKLEIVKVYLDDDGTYSCVITNKAGENGCSCKISVKESQSKDSIVPMFLRKLDTQICDVGDTAIFETEVIGSPEPTVTWFANKIQLTEDSHHKMVYDGRIARLVLRNISLSYGGKVECKAENSSGKVSCDSLLVVQEVKKPPILKTQLTNMTFVSGKAAILECKVESNSVPDIIWRKNGSIIRGKGDIKQTYLDGVAKLEIGSACAEDSGKYDCVVKNDFGEVVTSCLLTIQNDPPRLEEPKFSRSEVTARRSLPASFTPKVETERIHQAKSSASKVMLVRQGSLRSMNRDGQSSLLKRTGSFHGVSVSNSSVKKVDNDEAEQKSEVKDRPEKTPGSMAVCSAEVRETSIEKLPKKDEPSLESREPTGELKSGATHDTVLSNEIHCDGKHLEVEKARDKQACKVLMTDELNKVDMNLVEHSSKDMNSNITKTVSNNIVPQDQNSKALKLEIQIDSNKSVPKVDKDKLKEKERVSEDKDKSSIKRSSFGEFDKTPVSRFKAGSELRRTQSNRTPGSEKPEWLQVKLRKVANTPLSSAEKQSIEKNPNYNSPQNTPTEVSYTPVSVQKDIKLSRSQSARVVDRKTSPVLKDSTNSPSNDPAKKTVKLTPVSERAKIFLANERKSPSGKPSPTDIIAKAINLSRTESLKSPISQRPFIVQRSGSFKAEERSSQPGDITLNLSPQESQGQDKRGETGSTRKVIQVWDPTAPATTKMDYSTINDEEQLNKLLNDCENFEERKKLRARLKELREAEMKAWEAKRQAREKTQEDFIKKKHREADLEKQKKLEQFKEQAKEHHEPKHLEVAEKNLREKYRQADIAKQKQLEAFDRMARKEDVKQTSKVSTEVSTDGKTTTTTRKVETVTSVSGRGAAGRPAEEIAPQMLKQFINATSPSVSGQLSVKTQSWSSKDGVTRTSEKTESWGGKPVNPFKAADAANAKTNPLVAYTYAKKAATTMKRNAVAIKQEVLYFCQKNTAEYEKIEIQNFSTSWNDGIAFCALIHHFYPEAFDFYSLDPKQRRKNFELAFDTAEKYADIAPLLDVEDMVMMKKPDWKCVFTYVQSFYRKLKDHDKNKVKSAEA